MDGGHQRLLFVPVEKARALDPRQAELQLASIRSHAARVSQSRRNHAKFTKEDEEAGQHCERQRLKRRSAWLTSQCMESQGPYFDPFIMETYEGYAMPALLHTAIEFGK
jgi:hypothetical protein